MAKEEPIADFHGLPLIYFLKKFGMPCVQRLMCEDYFGCCVYGWKVCGENVLYIFNSENLCVADLDEYLKKYLPL